MLVLSFKNGDDNPARNSFDKCYIPLLEIKDFNALINNKSFFVHPVKDKHELYKKLLEMSRNYDYITRNFLDYSYNQNSYKPTGIDLLRQAGTFKKLMSQEK